MNRHWNQRWPDRSYCHKCKYFGRWWRFDWRPARKTDPFYTGRCCTDRQKNRNLDIENCTISGSPCRNSFVPFHSNRSFRYMCIYRPDTRAFGFRRTIENSCSNRLRGGGTAGWWLSAEWSSTPNHLFERRGWEETRREIDSPMPPARARRVTVVTNAVCHRRVKNWDLLANWERLALRERFSLTIWTSYTVSSPTSPFWSNNFGRATSFARDRRSITEESSVLICPFCRTNFCWWRQ